MMFFFKKPEITIDCFTFLEVAQLNYPIAPASKSYPFKNISNFVEHKYINDPRSNLKIEYPTIRKCDGVTDLYSNGFMLPAWDSFKIEVLNDQEHVIQSTANHVIGETHGRWQVGNDIYKGYAHVKVISPWFVKEKEGVKFTWNQPTWNKTENLTDCTILSAVVDFKYQFLTHVNMFIKTGAIVGWDAGDPLVHLIPMSERRVKIKTHCIDIHEYEKIRLSTLSMAHYSNHRNMKYPDFFGTEKKCPFGFGK